MSAFVKDPNAIKDYQINWATWLGSDTITGTPVWTVPTGITAGNGANGAPAPSNTTTTTTIWLIGGTANVDYTIVNRITTAAGRTEDHSITIYVREQ